MTEPPEFSDPNVAGQNRRDRHMSLNEEERARLAVIESELAAWEADVQAAARADPEFDVEAGLVRLHTWMRDNGFTPTDEAE